VDLKPTTTECVERIFETMIPGAEFVSTGMMKFDVLSRFFGKQTLGGSHPNCESATLVVSDGERYQPISKYLKIPLSEMLVRLRKLDSKLALRASALPARGLRRRLFNAGTFFRMVAVLARDLNLTEILGKPRILNGILAITNLLRGRKIDRILNDRTRLKHVLTLLTIPYEDKGGLEDARLRDCPAVFAYEDVQSGQIKTTAFCSWQTVKDEVCRRIQTHYDLKRALEQSTRKGKTQERRGIVASLTVSRGE
jgi:hypothetical protein